jgi:hypothetical protein
VRLVAILFPFLSSAAELSGYDPKPAAFGRSSSPSKIASLGPEFLDLYFGFEIQVGVVLG